MKSVLLNSKLLAVIMLLTGFSAYAYGFESGVLCYNILSEEDRTVEVVYSYSLSGDIEIPRNVIYNSKTYTVTSIGEQAFFGCDSMTSVTIPNSVTSIGEQAFFGCHSLTSVTIPNSVTSIGEYAFSFCFRLTSVTIPNSVTSIGARAFDGCESLTSVTIPNSVTSIEEYAFFGCVSLTSVTIPNSVTSIGVFAFSGCSSLTSVTIPNSVTSIGESAFSYCSSLTSVTIPSSVTSIGVLAFYHCESLTSVTIPNSVTYIGEGAFDALDNLKAIYVHWEVPVELGLSMFYDEVYLNTVLYVPKGTKAAYKKVDPWRNFRNIEEEDYTDVDVIEADNNGTLQISVNNGTLTINGIGSHESISVYDMQGRTVYSDTSYTIDNLQSGLYIVKAKNRTVKISI